MIIFINGSINAGKSTVAKILGEKLPRTAVLEIDSLREMINWMPIAQAVPLNIDNAIALVKNFVKEDLNVIVPYPLSRKNYDYIINNLRDIGTDIFAFTLSPRLESAMLNRGTRELDDKERERIKYHYEIGIPSPDFGEIIDNSDQTPEETAKLIMDKIGVDTGGYNRNG